MNRIESRIEKLEQSMAPKLSFQERLVFVDFKETGEDAFRRRGIEPEDYGDYIVIRWDEALDPML